MCANHNLSQPAKKMSADLAARIQKLENRKSADQLVTGIHVIPWLRILRRRGWNVHSPYLLRAARILAYSLPISALGLLERLIFSTRIKDQKIDPTPIFVLGHWRSGTTHLHNVLGRDPNHTFSTVYQAVFPTIFLTTGRMGPRLLAGALPSTRSYDAVKHGWHEAAEDEIALMKLTEGLSFYTGVMFPDDAEEYKKYIDFQGVSQHEVQRWKEALLLVVKKIMLSTGGKRVVLKSCLHSARISLLLELFPDAKFVHIHRHPARVFVSMLHMRRKVDWENFLQRPRKTFLELRKEHTAVAGELLFRRLIEDRALIPKENLFEIRYDEFCGQELEIMEKLYSQFALPDWEQYSKAIGHYLEGLRGYRRNPLEIDPETLDFVRQRWSLVYDTYGYPREFDGL